MGKLERISQTDIACVWSAQKKDTQEKYKAVPINQMPCFESKTEEAASVDANVLASIRQNLISALPSSAVALHK